MIRYDIKAKPYKINELVTTPSETGEWVKAEDVESLQKDMTEALRLLSITKSAMWGSVHEKIDALLKKYGEHNE